MPVFQGVSARNVASALRAARVVLLRRGETFVRRGEPLPGLCATIKGRIKLCVSVAKGEERIFGLVGAGESFAEAAALCEAASPFDVIALDDAQVIILPVDEFRTLLVRDRRLALNLVLLLAERTLTTIEEMEAGALQRAPQRLAAYLASLAKPAGGTCRVTLPVSKTLLAARLGVKKATLSRLLRQLATQGTIAMDRRDITILDGLALERASSGRASSA